MDVEENENFNQSLLTLYVIVEYNPQRYISAAVFDQRRRLFLLTSFPDNEHYTNLESLLIQLNSREANEQFQAHISIRTDIKSEHTKIMNKLVDLEHYVDKSVPKSHQPDVQLPMSNLLQKELVYYLKEMEDKKALLALERLLRVLELEKDPTNKNQFTIEVMKLHKFMKLDQPVINALLIFPKDMDKRIIAGNNTIFEILNICKMQIGTRCLKRWMRQPLQDREELEARLDKVEELLKDPVLRNSIQNELKKIPDLDSLYYVFYKVEAGKKNSVEVQDLIKVYRTVKIIEEMLKSASRSNKSASAIGNMLDEINKNVGIISRVCLMIEDNIIMEGRDNEFHVRPEAQQELSVISKEQNKVAQQITAHVSDVSRQLGVEVQKLNSSVHRYVLEADKKKSIEHVKETQSFKYLTSKQNKITFTTDQLTSLCKTLMYLEEEYKEQEKGILKKMYKVVAGYYPIMEQLSKMLSELDVLCAYATVINSMNGGETVWSRPSFTTFIKGEKIHHPCVKTCVPNDCDISEHKTIILTGPNMGGKSTYIRTIGLAVYLAHIGCYVPAKKLETSIVDSIITRVGASDMQIKGISTFMSEMIESVTMLRSATSSSLVLIDELGRGTSTSQGFGIAWAICSQLHKKTNPFCLFATHFHEMTKMAEELPGVKNMYTSCRFEGDQLHLEYKVVEGKMEKSYGLEVAKMLKFPPAIIENAQRYLSLYQNQHRKLKEQNGEQKALTPQQNQALALFKKMKVETSQLTNEADIRVTEGIYREKIKAVLRAQ